MSDNPQHAVLESVHRILPSTDEPSPSERKMIAGCMLIDAGMSIRKAAIEVGVDRHSLRGYQLGRWTTGDRPTLMTQAEQRIEDLVAEVAMQTAEKCLERLNDDERPVADRDLIRMGSWATQTLAIRRGWTRTYGGGDARAVDALAAALDAMREKATNDAAVSAATDVTPQVAAKPDENG